LPNFAHLGVLDMGLHKSESYLANRREKKHREKENSKKLQVTCRGSNYLLRRERMAAWHGGAPSSDCGCGGGSQRGSKIRQRAAHDHARPPTAAPATATSRAAPSSELIRVSAVGGIGCLGFAAAPASRSRRESRGTRVGDRHFDAINVLFIRDQI
jgi:hypothetical protein